MTCLNSIQMHFKVKICDVCHHDVMRICISNSYWEIIVKHPGYFIPGSAYCIMWVSILICVQLCSVEFLFCLLSPSIEERLLLCHDANILWKENCLWLFKCLCHYSIHLSPAAAPTVCPKAVLTSSCQMLIWSYAVVIFQLHIVIKATGSNILLFYQGQTQSHTTVYQIMFFSIICLSPCSFFICQYKIQLLLQEQELFWYIYISKKRNVNILLNTQ